MLVQLCAPRNAIIYFQTLKENKEKSKLEYMLKMNKASDAYARNSSIKDLAQVTDCPAKSEHARRAIALFPSTKDCRAVLETSMIENDYTAHEITFE